MSCDSWEEVASSRSPTHSVVDDADGNGCDDAGVQQQQQQQQPAKLVFSGGNIDQDVDDGGLLRTVRGGATLMFVIGVWMIGVSMRPIAVLASE